jgi:hypothetical protein
LKHGVPQGSILGPLLFIKYINDLHLRINSIYESGLFSDDTSVIISSRNIKDFCSVSNLVLSVMIKWFAANKLVLNVDKTNYLSHSTLYIGYKEKYTEDTVNTKFLGSQIDNQLNWKNCIEEMIPKLRGACYALRSMVHITNINTLKPVYYAYFHSIIKYEIIFWDNSSNIGRFSLYKRKLSELWLVHNSELHIKSIKQLEILPVPCKYIFLLTNFIVSNQENFQTNSSVHNINARNMHHLHRPNAKLSCFQKSTLYAAGAPWRSWLRHYVAGSIPDGVIGINSLT